MVSRTRPAFSGACLLAAALVAACTPTQRQPRHDPRSADRCDVDVKVVEASKTASDRPVITTLQTRDHEVTVYGGSDGLRFTISVGETVLAQMLDEQEFSNSFPSLHRHFESAFAQDSWVDASFDREAGEVRGAWGGL